MKSILESLGVCFEREGLLEEALRHASYCNEVPGDLPSNERLEFLGDAVLSLAVADWFTKRQPQWREGELTRARSLVVNEGALARAAEKLSLSQYIKVGVSERANGAHLTPSILCCAFEALVGAVYVDSGYAKASEFVQKLLADQLEEAVSSEVVPEDPKSKLQILMQDRHKTFPLYQVIAEEGPDHSKLFIVRVMVGDRELGQGVGSSKKEAEQEAASRALKMLCQKRRPDALKVYFRDPLSES